MSSKYIQLTDNLHHYMLSVSLREPAILQEIRLFTQALPSNQFMLAPEQGQFLAWLLKAIGAKRVLEIGTYTGYSSTAMALALPADGQLMCCDTSAEFTQHAQRFWQQAGVQDKVVLHLKPARETLEQFIADKIEFFDLIFIDADKANYMNYYELSLQLLKPNGVIVFDNTLWHGQVVDLTNQDNSTKAIRQLNQALQQDERVDISLLPLGDGMTLLRKR